MVQKRFHWKVMESQWIEALYKVLLWRGHPGREAKGNPIGSFG